MELTLHSSESKDAVFEPALSHWPIIRLLILPECEGLFLTS